MLACIWWRGSVQGSDLLPCAVMSRITRSEVEHVAKLACLALEGDECERMAHDLDEILGYVEALRGLDTEGIEPTAHAIPLATPLREDRPEPAMEAELAVACAPARGGTAFSVPKFVEGADEV